MSLSATPAPAVDRSCPPAQPSFKVLNETEYQTSSAPARATSTISLFRIHVLTPFPVFSLSHLAMPDLCCRGNKRIEVSILLLPAWIVLLPAVCQLCCVAEYQLSDCAVACVLPHHALDPHKESTLCLDDSHLALWMGKCLVLLCSQSRAALNLPNTYDFVDFVLRWTVKQGMFLLIS